MNVKKAFLIRDVSNERADRKFFFLSENFPNNQGYETRFVITSCAKVDGVVELMVFPADETGETIEADELATSRSRSYADLLWRFGYIIE